MLSTRRVAAFGFSALIAFGAPTGKAPAADENFSPAQRKAIEEVVRQVLRDNPEILVEAIRAARAKQETDERSRAAKALSERRKDLERNPTSPTIGNPDGDVTVVEFFDYRCGFCKRAHPTMTELLKSDPKVRVVLKEFPILGPESILASRAALAVHRMEPAKYRPFHDALMIDRAAVSRERLLQVAKSVGIDIGKLEKGIADPAIDAIIGETVDLAQALGINGTPAFVIGDQIVPGAVDIDTLKQLIAKARKG